MTGDADNSNTNRPDPAQNQPQGYGALQAEPAPTQPTLAKTEERLARAIDIGGLGYWELDLASGEFATSALCRRNFGRDPHAKFDYDDLVASIHPDDRERQARTVAQAVETQTAFDIEYRLLTPAGELRWAEIRGRFEATGSAGRLVGVSLDITTHKRAQAASARLAAIVESSDDAIVSISADPVGLIQSWNDAAQRLFGYTAAEAIGQPTDLVTPPDRMQESAAILNRALRGERLLHYETVRCRKDGSAVDVALTISPITDATGRVVGVSKIARDVSERRRLQRLREQQARLLELIASGATLTACLEALCLAVPQISHDVRASIMLADGTQATFQRPIAPQLNTAWGDGLAGTPINALMIDICGEAVFRGQAVTCTDVSRDARWSAEWRELCQANGVHSGYSVPVWDTAGQSVAAFMLCFSQARGPSVWEQELADFGSHIASIALARHRTDEALRETVARQRTQKDAFEAAVAGRPLAVSLEFLLRHATARITGAPRAAFYLADDTGTHLQPIDVASGMTPTYTAAMAGMAIGPQALSSGVAMHTGEPCITVDVFADQRWAQARHLATAHDFRGCWAWPIYTATGCAHRHIRALPPAAADCDAAGSAHHRCAHASRRHYHRHPPGDRATPACRTGAARGKSAQGRIPGDTGA